jgi:cytochrome c oxidase cbb3-type subunit 2
MKNGLTLFLGVFAILAASWAGVLLAAHRQIGSLAQFKDPIEETLNPQPLSGVANQGRLVYQDLGCVSCHTQQVRHDENGADIKRGWGDRGSYARDYIRDESTLIGQSRLGPDLRNVGKRQPDAEYLYKLLYAPDSTMAGEALALGMPAYRFLFELRPLVGNQPSYKAVRLPANAGVPAGYEVVPTARAEALVTYLRSLQDSYDYPTERSLNAPGASNEEGAANAKPAEAAPSSKPAPAGSDAAKAAAATPGASANPPADQPAAKGAAAKSPAATSSEKPKEGGH